MQAEDVYLEVLREFVQIVGADAAALASGSEVSFEFDGMLAFVFFHPKEDAVVVDVEILQLHNLHQEPANLDRLLLLHQLNSITRFTHGATAHVSVDDMLLLSTVLPVRGLSGRALAECVGQMLDTASDLRAAWSDLRSLIRQAGQSVEASAASPVVPMMHSLA